MSEVISRNTEYKTVYAVGHLGIWIDADQDCWGPSTSNYRRTASLSCAMGFDSYSAALKYCVLPYSPHPVRITTNTVVECELEDAMHTTGPAEPGIGGCER